MNKEQFINYLQNPKNLNAGHASKLEGLLHEFPYCQSARILHLKALHNEKSIHYPSRLKLTAAYAADRKSLYKFIMQDELISKISFAEKSLNESPMPKATVAENAEVGTPITPKETLKAKEEAPSAETKTENKVIEGIPAQTETEVLANKEKALEENAPEVKTENTIEDVSANISIEPLVEDTPIKIETDNKIIVSSPEIKPEEKTGQGTVKDNASERGIVNENSVLPGVENIVAITEPTEENPVNLTKNEEATLEKATME
ncbi:MAG: hypothetical protein H0X62_14925, partial [Bacteroidetes bacterium]|nr:hypothetical protein [Bacteroidota bacterium]